MAAGEIGSLSRPNQSDDHQLEKLLLTEITEELDEGGHVICTHGVA